MFCIETLFGEDCKLQPALTFLLLIKNTLCFLSITPVKNTFYLALLCLNYSKIKVSPNISMAEIVLCTFLYASQSLKQTHFY